MASIDECLEVSSGISDGLFNGLSYGLSNGYDVSSEHSCGHHATVFSVSNVEFAMLIGFRLSGRSRSFGSENRYANNNIMKIRSRWSASGQSLDSHC